MSVSFSPQNVATSEVPALNHLRRLIAFPSISTTSNLAINDAVASVLGDAGFDIQRQTYVDESGIEKSNLIARRDPVRSVGGSVGLAYFSHTDVVPARGWSGPGGDPFVPATQNDRVYGRGTCDMKGSIATMLAAVQAVDRDDQVAPLWFVCTADEERHLGGARRMVQQNHAYRELVERDPVAIIGEPTRLRVTHAHKGIVGLRIHSRGRAAHSSTEDGLNANEAMVPMLQTLLELSQRCRNDASLRNHDFDPPTLTWNFGVSDHATAINIVPDHSVAWVMFRTMPGVDGADLVSTIQSRADSLGLKVEHTGDCQPLFTSPGSPFVKEACRVAMDEPSQTACYATDGAVLTELSKRIVWGPGDIRQAHTTDEFIEIEQLIRGTRMYADAIRVWSCGGG